MFIAAILIVASIIFVTLFIILLHRQNTIGKEAIVFQLVKAHELFDQNKTQAALTEVIAALKKNGWDYEAFLRQRRLDARAILHPHSPLLLAFGRLIRRQPADNLSQVIPAFFFLAEIYQGLGQNDNRKRLFNEIRRLILAPNESIELFEQADLLNRISVVQAEIEYEERNPREAIVLVVESWLWHIESLLARKEYEKITALLSSPPSTTAIKALADIGLEESWPEIVAIIKNGIEEDEAQINRPAITKTVDLLLKSKPSLTKEALDRETAQKIVRRIFEKDTDEPDPGEQGGAIKL